MMMRKFNLSKLISSFRENVALPKNLIDTMWIEVIWAAIKNKYPHLTKSIVTKIVCDNQYSSTDNLGILDIFRQLDILRAIENKWLVTELNHDVVIELSCSVYGISRNELKWREGAIELLGGYTTEVPSESIEREMKSFSELLNAANEITASESLAIQLEMAARIFTKLVYIHPFPDGNGRVARFLVNLLFRKWNLPYITIPKVRNNSEWLDAIQNAFNGNYDMVIAHFKKWLFEMLEKLEELNSETSVLQKSCETGEVNG
jgi:prophage maintenance system killer protein